MTTRVLFRTLSDTLAERQTVSSLAPAGLWGEAGNWQHSNYNSSFSYQRSNEKLRKKNKLKLKLTTIIMFPRPLINTITTTPNTSVTDRQQTAHLH